MALLNFIKYNNIVPITVSFVLLGASGAYAAANPEVLLSTNETIVAIDNTYIAGKDLSDYTPQVVIGAVTEDEEFYYVSYQFITIDLFDAVWQDLTKEEVMKVSKADLGEYGDLGLYVTAQLKQKIDRELARLKETQQIEQQQISQKTVAIAYGGLVGAFLDTTTETIPGYEPVVVPPKPPEPPPVSVAQPEEEEEQPEPEEEQEPAQEEQEPQQEEEPAEEEENEEDDADTQAPQLQILGDNPARVEVGASYTDLGVAATDDSNETLAVRYFVKGAAVDAVVIDTSEAGEWVVRYEATDSAGNVGSIERRVEVHVPPSQGGGEDVGGGAPTTTPTEPEPQPTPEPEPPVPSEPVVNEVEPVEGEPEPTPEPPPAE